MSSRVFETLRPSTLTTMSSFWKPAASAGEPAATSRTRTSPVGPVAPIANAAVRTAIARMKFIVTPATSTIACAHHGFEVNARGSPSPSCLIEKSSWPRILTKPPKGIQFSV
jgi:hypothetical protein